MKPHPGNYHFPVSFRCHRFKKSFFRKCKQYNAEECNKAILVGAKQAVVYKVQCFNRVDQLKWAERKSLIDHLENGTDAAKRNPFRAPSPLDRKATLPMGNLLQSRLPIVES